jgi:hydrogenase maturation factor HypE
MFSKITGYGWQFTYIDGDWLSKAIPYTPIKSVHGEKPPYQVCEQLEDNYSKHFDNCINNAIKDINHYLNI